VERSYTEAIYCYTNNVHNKDGGTHLTGLRTALTKTINTYGTAHNLFKELKQGLAGRGRARGPHLRHQRQAPRPVSFDSQTKSKLVSSEVKGIVENVVTDKLGQFFEENPQTAKQDHREGRRRRQGARGRAQGARGHPQGDDRRHLALRQARRLPVEGPRRRASSTSSRARAPAAAPSRGATGISRRSSRSRARSSTSSARASTRCSRSAEVGTLITALGCGIGDNGSFEIDKLRYHRSS
jgi:DNA gyrase subunit B